MKTNYIGLDPSMAAFGVAIIDTNTKTIILDQFKSDNHHNFVFMSWAITNMFNEIKNKYKEYINEDTIISQEAPISAGINAGKLNALGYCFYTGFGFESKYKNIKTYHPMKLKVFHHKKGYSKNDTIKVVEDILNIMQSMGYTLKVEKSAHKKDIKITDGEADAFMYCFKSLIDNNNEQDIIKDVLDKYPRFEFITSIEESMEHL